jgi:4-amino-4-deoxy-L-arabinose transferase-like glycosyltransferase
MTDRPVSLDDAPGGNPAWRSSWREWLSRAALAGAVIFLGLYAFTALHRLTYLFELEWEEGAFVDHVIRLVSGQKLYVEPTLDFIPFVYTPGYYYAAAGAALLLGASAVTLRIVSILCSVGIFGVLAAFGRKERGTGKEGLLLAGLFAATYAIGGAWLDVARVDSLFLFLTLAGLYGVRFGRTTTALVATGMLLAGALLTKQVGLILGPILLLYPVVRLGRRGLIPGVTFLATATIAVVALEWESDGWFLYYTYYVLTRTQAVFADRLASFWTTDLLGALPILTVLGLTWCVIASKCTPFEDWTFYAIAGIAFLGSSWETRLHPGAWLNTLMPAYAFLVLAGTRMAGVIDRRVSGLGSGLVVAQMVLLAYNPARYIPSEADRTAAEQFMAYLHDAPGEVLMLDHGYFPTLVGKRAHAHEMAVRDVLLTDDRYAHELSLAIRQALAEHQFGVIIQDTPDWFPIPLGRYYQPIARLHSSPDVMWPRSGHRIRPELVYAPRPE